MKSDLIIFLSIVTLSLGGESARAQSAPDDPCLRDVGCQALLTQAHESSQAGRYDDALSAYQSAYSRSTSPWLMVNIGRMRQKLGRFDEALRSYRDYLSTPRLPGDEEERAAAQKYLQELEKSPLNLRAALEIERKKEIRLHAAKWVVGVLGVGAVIVGAALWALNGQPTCTLQPGQVFCPERWATQSAGIALVAGGGALVGSSVLLFGLDYQANQKWGRLMTLTLSGGF